MTKIILIHGINNQNNSAERIVDEWREALRRGAAKLGVEWPAAPEFAAAFYGDILHEETSSWGAATEAVSAMGPDALEEDKVSGILAALYLDAQRAAGITDEEVRQYLDEEDRAPTADPMAKGIHKKWLKAIARALEEILPSRGRIAARTFLKQAACYLEKPGVRKKIDDAVFDQVFADVGPGDEVIVVSHSLGTVIGYSLLRQLTDDVQPKLFLTAGSPLGIEIVKLGLLPPLICLENAPNWVNLSDEEDFVALHPKLTEKTFGCGRIINHTGVDNGYADAHDIRRYLEDKEAVRSLLDALRP